MSLQDVSGRDGGGLWSDLATLITMNWIRNERLRETVTVEQL